MQRMRLSEAEDKEGGMALEARQPQQKNRHQVEAPEGQDCQNGQEIQVGAEDLQEMVLTLNPVRNEWHRNMPYKL